MNRFRATAVAVLWALAVTASVHAADGRITFNGAIVVSTCGPARTSSPPARPATPQAHSQCHDAGAPAGYTLQMEPASAHANSPLVTYYADYVRAAGGGESVWVATQVYD